MSIVSAAWRGKILWPEAAVQIEAWAEKLLGKDLFTPAVSASVSVVKQGVSIGIGLADTAIADHLAQVTDAAHVAADGALMKASAGAALPAIPLVNATIDQIAAAGAAAFHAWALETKAGLTTDPRIKPLNPNTLGALNPAVPVTQPGQQ